MSSYRPGFGRFSFFPSVIKNLLIINGVVFFLQLIGNNIKLASGLLVSDIIIKYFALIPLEGFTAGRMGFEQIIWNFYPWQLITYQFLHGGFTHILFNMFVLWMFGMEIENMWGGKKFIYFYLLCGVFAGLCHLIISPVFGLTGAPTIGASGAIYGLLAAFALLFPNRMIFLWFLIPVKAKYLITFLILLDIFALNDPGNVARLAHLGGALAGFIYLMMDRSTPVSLREFLGLDPTRRSTSSNPFKGFGSRTKREDIQEAKYYDLKDDKGEEGVSQEELDRILDKISQTGYQNLTEREKKILFEISKKMNKE